MDLAYCKDRLSKAGVRFDSGLTAREFFAIEQSYGFVFTPDLREFLAYALPVSTPWPGWRSGSRSELNERLQWPYEGICFDIQHNSFWPDSWGPKPATLPEAYAVARTAIDAAPRLIPICGHRYIPDRPHDIGNPIYSVHQTDIIYYGADLFDYFCNEFLNAFDRSHFVNEGPLRRIEFWSDIADQ
jgi:hypothetical protein